jgi:hypothetical protein
MLGKTCSHLQLDQSLSSQEVAREQAKMLNSFPLFTGQKNVMFFNSLRMKQFIFFFFRKKTKFM